MEHLYERLCGQATEEERVRLDQVYAFLTRPTERCSSDHDWVYDLVRASSPATILFHAAMAEGLVVDHELDVDLILRGVCDSEVERVELVALDTLARFPAHSTDRRLLEVAHKCAHRSGPVYELLRMSVVQGVLNTFRTYRVDSENADEYLIMDSTMQLVLDYDMIRCVEFRTGNGITHMLRWWYVAIASDTNYLCEHMRDIVTRCLELYPEYILHSPITGRILVTLVAEDNGFPIVRLFLERTPLQTLLILSSVLTNDSFTQVLFYIRAMSTSDEWAVIRSHWPTRIDGTDGSVPNAGGPRTRYECPITLEPCSDPVMASDGFTYERDAILRVISMGMASPMTREPLDRMVVPNPVP